MSNSFFNIHYFGNWSCLLPSHLSRHGDSSFFFSFSRQNGRSCVSSAATITSPFLFPSSSGHPFLRFSAEERWAGQGATRSVASHPAPCGLPRTIRIWVMAGRRHSKHIINLQLPNTGPPSPPSIFRSGGGILWKILVFCFSTNLTLFLWLFLLKYVSCPRVSPY